MKIRNAQMSDFKGIGIVHTDSWKETYNGLIPQEYLDNLLATTKIDFWRENLKKKEKREYTWVAESDEGKIIGFCCGGKPLNSNFGYESELYAIYLYKKYHGQKIGKALFKSLVAKLIEDGHKQMYLWVVKNSKTCKIYESLGGILQAHVDEAEFLGQKVKEIMYLFELKDLNI